jgi:hypothetical protein
MTNLCCIANRMGATTKMALRTASGFTAALFALWRTFAPTQTAKTVGHDLLSRSGESGYRVVHGGGPALFFRCARASEQCVGLILALTLYAPIVVCRRWLRA